MLLYSLSFYSRPNNQLRLFKIMFTFATLIWEGNEFNILPVDAILIAGFGELFVRDIFKINLLFPNKNINVMLYSTFHINRFESNDDEAMQFRLSGDHLASLKQSNSVFKLRSQGKTWQKYLIVRAWPVRVSVIDAVLQLTISITFSLFLRRIAICMVIEKQKGWLLSEEPFAKSDRPKCSVSPNRSFPRTILPVVADRLSTEHCQIRVDWSTWYCIGHQTRLAWT